MDPNICLARLAAAITEGNVADTTDRASDLLGWLASGGFPPAATNWQDVLIAIIHQGDEEPCDDDDSADGDVVRRDDFQTGWAAFYTRDSTALLGGDASDEMRRGWDAARDDSNAALGWDAVGCCPGTPAASSPCMDCCSGGSNE